MEISIDGCGVPLAPLERNLLTFMALAARKVLSTDRIIDSLWGDKPPVSPRSRVQGLISSLRRKAGDVLVTRQPGYLLDVADDRIDIGRCENLARRARAADSPADTAALLAEALRLWRGEALDGVTAPGLDADRARLTEWRLGLLEDRFDADLALGRHFELVGELLAAVVMHPLRERLAGRLMVAQYRCDRRAEALGTYQALRDRLVEELGSEPCAEIRELHTAILRGERLGPAARIGGEPRCDPPREEPQRPVQMPAGVGHFTGRRRELDALTRAVPEPENEPRVPVVSGAGGLGKTALVVHWAHRMADRFPDGQIFVELDRPDGDASRSIGSALGTILLALGVGSEQLPVSVDERAALYRTLVHDRRVLVVVDDVSTVNQLLPLVPPTGSSLVVATSRHRLSALSAHHAVSTLTIEPLGPRESYDLMRAIVGPRRLRGQGSSEVVELCGGWPLALRLAAATLAARPQQSLVSFAAELRDHVDDLSVTDDPRTVRGALAETYLSLEPAAARLFAQLGVAPGATVSLALAAAATGTTVRRARRLLDELIAANLVVETGPDRYRLHDMVRRYARHRADELPDREVVEERVLRWYLDVLGILALRADPSRDRPPGLGHPEWSPITADGSGAQRFIEAETPNFPNVATWIADRGDHALTWQSVVLAHTAGVGLSIATCQLGLDAARRLDDRHALAEAHTLLGMALLRHHNRLDEADEHLCSATRVTEPRDDRMASAASFGLGLVRARQSRPVEAREAMEKALRGLDPGFEPLSYAVALSQYAEVLARSGLVERGHERFAQAVILYQATLGRRADRFGQFGRPWEVLNCQLADEYLADLESLLDMSRVSEPDRGLARFLIRASTPPRPPAPREQPVVNHPDPRPLVAHSLSTSESKQI